MGTQQMKSQLFLCPFYDFPAFRIGHSHLVTGPLNRSFLFYQFQNPCYPRAKKPFFFFQCQPQSRPDLFFHYRTPSMFSTKFLNYILISCSAFVIIFITQTDRNAITRITATYTAARSILPPATSE